MNMVALVDGRPRLLNLKQMLDCFPVASAARSLPAAPCSNCARSASAGHVLEGPAVRLSNVDEIIA